MGSIGPNNGTTSPYDTQNRTQEANDASNALYQGISSQPWGQQFWDKFESSNVTQALANGTGVTQSGDNTDVFAGMSSNDLQTVKNALYNIVAESPLASDMWGDLYNAGLVPDPSNPQGAGTAQAQSTGGDTSAPSTTGGGASQSVSGAGVGGSGSAATWAGSTATSAAGSTATGVTGSGSTASGSGGGLQTSDGYTVANCVQDMKNLANAYGKPVPDDGTLNQLATGIIQGVNANFSGTNSIGNFGSVPGSDMAKYLVVSAFQESNYGMYGEDAGGVFQTAQIRLDQYNAAHGTNITEDQLQNNIPLASQVGTWCMSTVIGTLGLQAGNDPIPGGLGMQALYYWNYHAGAGHGHTDELGDYMQDAAKNYAILGGT